MIPRRKLPSAVAEHARVRPDAPALSWRGGAVSYAELAAMADTAAAAVAELPPGPVGVVAEKSPETVALLLGCLAAGRRFLVPAPTLPTDTLTGLFERAGCADVLAAQGNRLDTHAASLTTAVVDVHAERAAPPPADPDPVSFLLTTSGSTGVPKIVPIEGGAVDRLAEWAGPELGLGPGRRVLNYAPLNFDLCLLEVWATLRWGGCVELVDPDRATDGAALLEQLDGVHVVQAVPMFFELLLAATDGPGPDSVAEVLVTGDALRPSRIADLHRLFPRARLTNVYGCTETNDSFTAELRPGMTEVPIGGPLPGVSALLVDEDGAVLAGEGVGELLVSTPFQTPGYLDSPDRFTGHPAGADALRYFRSGDLVRRGQDGALVLVGRTDFRIKVRGQQVDTGHLEQVLHEHPDVIEAAVLALPDPDAGHRLLAVVRRARPVNSLVLRKHCADNLPKAAIPSTLRFTDEPLPRTSTGKVDRENLKEQELVKPT